MLITAAVLSSLQCEHSLVVACGGFSCYGALSLRSCGIQGLEHLGHLFAVCRLSCSVAWEILVYSCLSTTTRDWIHVPSIGRWILEHCTTKEVLQFLDWSILDVTSWFCCYQFSSVQSLSRVQLFVTPWTAARQASCPSPTPGACSGSCPLSQWCHLTISSSVTPFSSCLPSFLASVSFPVSQFFTSGGQSIGASALALVLPMHIQDWFPLGLTGLISLQSKGASRVFSRTTVQKHQFFVVSSCRLLGVRSFVLEVRSWWGSDVFCKSPPTNVILFYKKGQGP